MVSLLTLSGICLLGQHPEATSSNSKQKILRNFMYMVDNKSGFLADDKIGAATLRLTVKTDEKTQPGPALPAVLAL